MRGLVDGLGVTYPLGEALPALYHEAPFIQRLCEALDEVLAPIPSAVDNFWAYLDPALTPEDFLGWLAAWVGVELDRTLPLDRQRALVANAAAMSTWVGTAGGLAGAVELATGSWPEIVEPGGVTWSQTPGTAPPLPSTSELVVRIRVADRSTVDLGRLERIVATAKPAHLLHRIELVDA